jgi:transcriptional regulator GlxA family with amidase domain
MRSDRISGHSKHTTFPALLIQTSKAKHQEYRESVSRVLALLDHRKGDVRSEELQSILGLKERQARKMFHLLAGESFRNARLRARLNPARELICSTSWSIADVAEEIGYSNRSKLDTAYARLFGITPAADRNTSD